MNIIEQLEQLSLIIAQLIKAIKTMMTWVERELKKVCQITYMKRKVTLIISTP